MPRYYTHPNYANSPFPAVAPGSCSGAPAISCTSYLQCPTGQTCNGASAAGGLRKFVDGLPLLGPGGANGLVTPGGDPAGQYIPVATADETTYPGSDYYVIVLGEYSEKLHSDLPATKLRGYRQANMGGTPFHYLGPAIVATKDRPVRILFRNALPTGAGGNLFIPVDTTVMGSGMGPGMFDPATGAMMEEMDPQRPMCGQTFDPVAKVQLPKPAGCYTENRATLHLHGGISPWISDGTPHQWITPAGEDTPYKKGVSVSHVPDMWFDAAGQTIASCAGQTTCTEPNATNDPGPGAMTFYYTNQQSARLMFYHDHAWGITRLNVYAGEAAPYVITDDTEKALVASGAIPGALDTIPLVVQDKTFVPDAAQLAAQDETWDVDRWGGPGSLWLPHVYSPAQNPGELTGVNGYGRWAYGPWFWPATVDIEHGPMDNPHIDPTCIPGVTALYCEPPTMPGVPYVSMGMESFHDTPLVNGTAYPTITLAPKAYRFRILNAANDRFFNLSLYKAVDARGVLCDANNPAPVAESTGETCTEVALNPAEVIAALADPAGVFPTPLASSAGPSWIQFATEGGFLPSPVEIPPQPITWVTDPTVFNAGNVDQHSLLLGPAERADVVVDLSAYAGQTLILYNDAPAAFPARDPRYDYYTANADLTESGGAPTTIPGYGPNTRTVMRIVVQGTPGPAFDLAKLEAAFAHNAEGTGVFESGQHPIIVGQSGYNAAYGKTFTDAEGFVQIFQTAITFNTLGGQQLTIPLRPKMIQDEMGEAFEHEYGRMSGFMGVETPNAQAGLQNMILYAYAHPPTEIIDAVEIPGTGGLQVSPISTSDDGTQIWKITHNGVDTHPVHFHLYEVQLLNRVGWDGIVRPPDANELGWKDTVRVSPLEDTIVALRPVLPHVPFDLPNSIRLLDPSMPDGAWIANTTAQEAAGLPLFAFNPDGEPIDIRNHYVNYGWEYVWHCHILSHEEMDMMRPQVVGVAPKAPGVPTWVVVGSGGNRANRLTWTDNSKNETAFVIERRALGSTGPWTVRATIPSDRLNVGPGTGARTYDDRIGTTKTTFEYQVTAINTVGDAFNYADPAFNEITVGGFPTLTLDSRGNATSSLAAPTLSVPAAFRKSGKIAGVTLQWSDPNAHERGFIIQRADNAGFSLGVVNATVGADVTTLTQNVSRGKTYYYRVQAFSETMSSAWSNVRSVTTP